MKNIDLGKTQITDDIRVSSAAIYYDMGIFQYYQFETFIFSDNPTIKTRQVIHGSSHFFDGRLTNKATKVHKYISSNLRELYNKHGYGRSLLVAVSAFVAIAFIISNFTT